MPGLRKAGVTFRCLKALVVSCLLMTFSFMMHNSSLFKALLAGEVFLNLWLFLLLFSRLFPVGAHLF